MAQHVCSACGHVEHIFGDAGGASLAVDTGVPLLGSLPLVLEIREQSDKGVPIVVHDSELEASKLYQSAALGLVANLSLQGERARSTFPRIVVVND